MEDSTDNAEEGIMHATFELVKYGCLSIMKIKNN